MAEDERDESDPQNEDGAESGDAASETDDTEGQTLTWKMKKPIPDVEDDAGGHSVRPPPEVLNPQVPMAEEDDAEGHAGPTGSPRPPVD